MNRNWEEFLAPYHQAVAELKVKLKGMRTQFAMLTEHSPIEFVTGRVKSVASIIDKAEKKCTVRQAKRRYARHRGPSNDVSIC